MSAWRFAVDSDGTITRGRAYRLPSDWTSDAWQHYWDGDMVAFIEGYTQGVWAVTGCEGPDTDRAIAAHKYERGGDKGAEGGLDRLAFRLTGNPDSRFICVGLDRGTDLYALSWGGDPDNEWRDEIEAVNNGDIWRIEVERMDWRDEWIADDEYPEEFYGEDKATAAWEKAFPLAQFPAERCIMVSA